MALTMDSDPCSRSITQRLGYSEKVTGFRFHLLAGNNLEKNVTAAVLVERFLSTVTSLFLKETPRGSLFKVENKNGIIIKNRVFVFVTARDHSPS
jgi:hypothetical protein